MAWKVYLLNMVRIARKWTRTMDKRLASFIGEPKMKAFGDPPI